MEGGSLVCAVGVDLGWLSCVNVASSIFTDDGGGFACVGPGDLWEISCFFPWFLSETKTALKKINIKKHIKQALPICQAPSSQQSYEAGPIIVPILQIRPLRNRAEHYEYTASMPQLP